MHHPEDDKRDYNRFEFVAQEIWAASSLEDKKKLIIEKMINKFEFKGKADTFRAAVAKATKASKIDKLAADLVLIQSGDRVI